MDGEEIMETQETAEQDGFLDGWEGEEAGGMPEESPAETEAPADSGETTASADEAPGETSEPAGEASGDGEPAVDRPAENRPAADQAPPRTWTLTHQGQTLTVNEQDLTALARKGLEYAGVQKEYDEGKPILELLGRFARQAGMTMPEYARQLRLQSKQAEGLSPEEARRQLELEDRENALAAKEAAARVQQEAAAQAQQRRQALEQKRDADIREFAAVFPQAAADPGSIPREVWADVSRGLSLTAAYACYSAAQAEQRLEAERQEQRAREQNAKNAAASAGSMRSAGADSAGKDPFLEGWEE